MKVEYTLEDGWDCEPKLKQVVKTLEELDESKYEIDRCVRASNLKTMVNVFEETLLKALEMVKEIDVEVEYITKYEDE